MFPQHCMSMCVCCMSIGVYAACACVYAACPCVYAACPCVYAACPCVYAACPLVCMRHVHVCMLHVIAHQAVQSQFCHLKLHYSTGRTKFKRTHLDITVNKLVFSVSCIFFSGCLNILASM